MPENNGQNINGIQKNSKNTLNHAQRMIKFRAAMAKKKQTFRGPNSGKFEHLRKTVETFKKNRDAYIKFKNHKMAEEMAQQNNEPKPEPVIEQVNQQKPETEIKNENNLVIEEPVIQEQLQKPADKVAKENGTETMNFEDIEVDDAALDDPKLDEELEQLEQKMKKEEELKKMGIDPESVEEPDDPKLTEEIKELMQETDEKLEGDALEEAFIKLSDEVEGEKKDSNADNLEENDPFVNDEIDRLEQEIVAEANANPDPVPVIEPHETDKKNDIIVEDVKEETEKIHPTETNEIKLRGEEKVKEPVENSEPKLEKTAPQNNAPDDEYVGLQEMFGEISLDNHNLTREQQEYVLEQARKLGEEKAKQQSQLNPNFMFEQWNRQQMQNNRNIGTNPQTNSKSNFNAQMMAGEMRIPGMNYVASPMPKAEEKKPPVSEPPKQVYVTEKIPGMDNVNFNARPAEVAHVPQMTKEELDAKILKDAEEQLANLRKMGRTSDPDERRFRAAQERRLQKIIDDANAIKAIHEQKKALDEAEKAKKEEAPAQNDVAQPEVAVNEENVVQNNEERVEPEQERASRPLDYLFEEDDEEELDPFANVQQIQIPQMLQTNVEPKVEEAPVQENNNPQRELTEEEKARRAAEDERLAQMMQNFRREMAELDAEEEREAQQNEERVEPKQERAPRPLDYLFEEDDEEELDPFANVQQIQIPQMPQANAEPKVEEAPVQENNNPQRELTDEEKARRAAEDERLAQMMQNFRREMAELDAEEEREAQANEEKVEVEPEQERPALPLDYLFEEDDEEELEIPNTNTIIPPQIPQIPQMPQVNAESKVEEAPVQENNNPPRELTEEEKARRAAEDERLAQMMQNHRREMAELDAEEEREAQQNEERVEPKQERASLPLDYLFEEDDEEELDPFANVQQIQIPQMPQTNVEPKVEEAPVQENNNPPRELTEEEKARRAAEDERLAQMMQNHRIEMAELDAEEEREAQQNEERVEPEQERAPRPLDYLFEEDDEEELEIPNTNTIIPPQIPQIPQMPQTNVEPKVEEAPVQENNNPQRELTDEEKARRAAEDERLAQMMQNHRIEMAELDAEEEREAQQNEERVEPEQERAPRPLEYLFEEDDEEELDPFANVQQIQIPQMPQANAEPKVEEAPVQENNNPPRELTEEEKARRAAEDERLAQMMQNFRREMAELDAEEEREAQQNEERVEPKQERAPRPLDYLFEEDDEEELDPFANVQQIQIPQMPQANAEPKVEEAPVQENNNPQRELTEEEKARRAAEDERLAQMMQNFRREMAELDAEEAAEEAAIQKAEENVEEAIAEDELENEVEAIDILGDAAEMVAALDAEPKELDNSVSATVFVNNLNTFNTMYKLGIDANKFAFSVNEAWTLLKSPNEQKKADGQKMLGDLFKNTLKNAFDVEKYASYDEHRLPEYAEIIKSSNELLRSAMFAFTDLYHNPKSASLFDSTAFGGLNAKEMADLTTGDSLWSMDQKSDEAWELQSQDAKNLADKWLKEDRPYEKMISEMKALVEADKTGIVDRKEILTKLTAAEWLLVNNDKMMIDDPEDPLNKIPNWGNRYWKALTEAREALGIDKHTSMRDLIQGDYAASAKAVISSAYNEAQIEDYVLDPAAREIYDSMELQKEQFATQSAAVTLTEPQNEIKADEFEMTEDRVPYPIKELDERVIMKNQPKNYDFVVEKTAELNMNGPNQV